MFYFIWKVEKNIGVPLPYYWISSSRVRFRWVAITLFEFTFVYFVRITKLNKWEGDISLDWDFVLISWRAVNCSSVNVGYICNFWHQRVEFNRRICRNIIIQGQLLSKVATLLAWRAESVGYICWRHQRERCRRERQGSCHRSYFQIFIFRTWHYSSVLIYIVDLDIIWQHYNLRQ